MATLRLHRSALIDLVRPHLGRQARALRLEVRPLRGGLSSSVVLVTARFRDGAGRQRCFPFVAKLLEGAAVREVAIYARLAQTRAGSLAPGLLGLREIGPGRWLLCLERIRPVCRWPWAEVEHAAQVLERLAEVHDDGAAGPLPPWDYERDVRACAEELLVVADRLRRRPWGALLRRTWPALRRVLGALPEIRRQLLGTAPLGTTLIHGDVHPGNVLLRRRSGRVQPVLLDWGRARRGSPLEDVSSWLRSLCHWEPAAMRRHDTLLCRYLSARGWTGGLGRGLRDAYWLAGASNALSGALLHHLSVLEAAAGTPAWPKALHAAHDWLRAIRRADACWS